MKTAYQTKQKRKLLEFFASHPDAQFSAREIADQIKSTSKIGESTVYRLIKTMTESGVLRRFHGKDTKSVVYQFAGNTTHCHQHFHLKCGECGELVHLNCELLSAFSAHMNEHHGFCLDPVQTILYGTCAACSEKEATRA